MHRRSTCAAKTRWPERPRDFTVDTRCLQPSGTRCSTPRGRAYRTRRPARRAVIIDASLVIDAVADPGPRGIAARDALAAERGRRTADRAGTLRVRGHVRTPGRREPPATIPCGMPTWSRLCGTRSLSGSRSKPPLGRTYIAPGCSRRRSLRYADAIYVAAAERQHTALLSADARIERSGAPVTCEIITVVPSGKTAAHADAHAGNDAPTVLQWSGIRRLY